MNGSNSDSETNRRAEQRAKNVRTGLLLGAIALAFFFGVILKHIYFG